METAYWNSEEWERYGKNRYKKSTGYKTVAHLLLNKQDFGWASSITEHYNVNNIEYPEKDHAEDMLVDQIGYVISCWEAQNIQIPEEISAKFYVGSSPCSSEYGTSNKVGEGCCERLLDLKQNGVFRNNAKFSVEVIYDHLYLPKNVEKPKDCSLQALMHLRRYGIVVREEKWLHTI